VTGQHYISDAQRAVHVEDLHVRVFEGIDVDEMLVSITWGQLTKNLAKPTIDDFEHCMDAHNNYIVEGCAFTESGAF
jgi:hypothetical protein